MSDPAPFATLRGLSKRFDNGAVALQDLDLSIARGAFLSLVGPSGCGKSTVLRLLAGLAAPTSGSIELATAPRARTADAAGVGYVFQDATLLPWRTALGNVALPLQVRGVEPAERHARALDALSRVGLAEHAAAYPRELSGGMKMRVSIARAIVTRPTVLLLDEPFAALDEITRLKLNDDLLQLCTQAQLTTVFVTHSVGEAVYLSQRVCVMGARPGRIVGDYAIDLPLERRRRDFRLSSAYHDLVRLIAQCLSQGRPV